MTSLISSDSKPIELLNEFREKLSNGTAVVGVVGLGYVGLPFAVEKAKVGIKVVGFDRNPERVAAINRGENYIKDVDSDELKSLVSGGLITATDSFDGCGEMDALVIAVPTPLNANLAPDLQYVRGVTEEIAKRLRVGQFIALESTTYPGTTEEVMLPILERSGLKVEEDFFLAHSPERVDPGNQRYTTKNTNKVVGGVGPLSQEAAIAFYSKTIEKIVPVSSAKVAEMCKVFENTFRAVNIALVNELMLLCDRMDISVWEVLTAAHTKPFGIMPFLPGPGVGGHCIPLDPHYLEWKAREFNFNTRFIALAGEINRSIPDFVIAKAGRVLNEAGKSLSRSVIFVLGIAYKRDIDDWRESPALPVYAGLEAFGATVRYHDPYVPTFHEHGKTFHSEPLDASTLREADLVLILTDHQCIDYDFVISNAKAVLDTRNATKNVDDPGAVVTLL